METESDFWSPHPDEQDVLVRELACGVIEQARDDVRWLARYRPMVWSMKEEPTKFHERADAMAFLTGATEDWQESLQIWCDLARVPVKAIQGDARQGCPRKMMTTVRNKQKPMNGGDPHA